MASIIFDPTNPTTEVKSLRDNLNLNDNAKVLSGDDNPTSVAKNAPRGSIYLQTGASGGSVFKKNDNGSTTNWEEIGAGAGGINHIPNPSAESGTTGWAAYADAAGVTPVDGTGGSPTVTITASSSSPLRGAQSFLLTKDAANRQGEGVSAAFTIDSADKNKSLSVTCDIELSANYVAGDAGIYIYDVTNAVLITPSSVNIDSGGAFQATFGSTGSTSYRWIMHVQTTNASAYTIKFDNVVVGPQEQTTQVPVGDWTAFSLTIGATTTAPTKGTIVRDEARWRRIGDSIEVHYNLEQSAAGASGSGTYLFPLPLGYQIDTAKVSATTSNTQSVLGVASAFNSGASEGSGFVKAHDSTNLAMSIGNSANNPALLGSGTYGLGVAGTTRLSFFAVVPVVGLSSEIVLSNAKTFKISSLLVNGTNVTAAPTAIGEYRTLIKDASAFTFTDDAPTAGPDASNGMRIYAKNHATAGTSGETNKWVIFVGKDKIVQPQYYETTGRSGIISADVTTPGTATQNGVYFDYDPVSGLAVIDAGTSVNTSITTRNVGQTITEDTAAAGAPTDCYFDVVVSEKAIPVETEAGETQILSWAFTGSPITGDQKPWIRVPFDHELISAYVVAKTAGTTASTITIEYSTQTNIDGTPSWTNIFSTDLTLDANERSSETAATPHVISSSQKFRSTNDHYRVQFTTVGTSISDVTIEMRFIRR